MAGQLIREGISPRGVMGRNGCGAKGSPYEEIFPPWRERKKPEDFFEILSGL
jgi:hypothetical protein